MADDDRRRVTLERLDTGVYLATNSDGVQLTFGSADGAGFSPVELLLAAIGGCSAADVDVVTGRRAAPERFEVEVAARYLREQDGNILRDLELTFDVTFPEGEDGDRARKILPRVVQASHDRTCTVTRTVEASTPVAVHIATAT